MTPFVLAGCTSEPAARRSRQPRPDRGERAPPARSRSPMPLYDAVKDLTLTIERLEAQAARPAAQAHHAPHHGRAPARGRNGGGRRGRLLRGGAAALVHPRGIAGPWQGEHSLDSFSRARRRAARLSAVAACRDFRRARPGAAPGGALARGGRRRASPRPSRSSSRRAPSRRLRALYPEIHFKLDASDKWTDDVVADSRRYRRRRRRRL